MPDKPKKSSNFLSAELKKQKRLEEEQKILRDYFNREQKFAEISHCRGDGYLENVCKKSTLDHLKNEINSAIQLFNHSLDKRQHTIVETQIDRKHAAEQHLRIFTFHSKLIDCMTDLYNLFHKTLKQSFDNEREHLLDDFFNESVNRERILYERRVYYENYEHAAVSIANPRSKHRNENFINREIEINAWSVEKRDEFEETENRKKEMICDEIQEIFNIFKDCWPKSRFNDYNKILTKDEEFNQEVSEVGMKIKKSEEIKEKLEKRLKIESFECLERISSLRNEQNSIVKILNSFQQQQAQSTAIDDVKMKKLIGIAEKSKKDLKNLLQIGKNILKALKICKKYERLSDKLVNFDEHLPSIEKNSDDVNIESSVSDETFSNEKLDKNSEISPKNTSWIDELSKRDFNFETFKVDSLVDEKTSNEELSSGEKLIEELTDGESSFSDIKVFPCEFLKSKISAQEIENIKIAASLTEFPLEKLEKPEKSSENTYLNVLQSNSQIYDFLACEFFSKLARVEAECLTLRFYKKNLTQRNENLRNLISKNIINFEVKENLKCLNINSLSNVGGFNQIASHISQINSAMRTRKRGEKFFMNVQKC